MGGLTVDISEPVNVVSTMLLAHFGPPKDAKPHALALRAAEHVEPFAAHPSVPWLAGFAGPRRVGELYGNAVQLAGPTSFVPRSSQRPPHLAGWERERMQELPERMAAFYADAKLGSFRRTNNAAYTLMAAEVKDAVGNARIDEFLARLYGPVKYKLVVVPVPTHPWAGGGVGTRSAWEAFALLFPPPLPKDATDPVEWSLSPEATQVTALATLGHPLLRDAVSQRTEVVGALEPILSAIPSDAPIATSLGSPGLRMLELFVRASCVSYLRRTRGDEAALRWMDGQVRDLGTPLLRDFFRAVEAYLEEGRWTSLDAFLADLPSQLGA